MGMCGMRKYLTEKILINNLIIKKNLSKKCKYFAISLSIL